MEDSYLPKVEEKELCDWINLCTVRKTEDWISKIGIKSLNGEINEKLLSEIINEDTYNNKKIIRVYSSWHIFLSDDKKEVFLLTTEKKWKIQHQFTGWSPLEDNNKNVIFKEDWIYKFDLEKVKNNAKIRTKNRTWVEVLEEYNEKPVVDWVLMENQDENWESFYKVVCLMHFIVKKYDWVLWFTWKEYSIDWKFYKINNLKNIKNISPNAYIVSKEAVKIINIIS